MVSGPAPSGLKTRKETKYCVNTARSSRVWLWNVFRCKEMMGRGRCLDGKDDDRVTLQSVGMFSKIIIYYLCLNNSGHLGCGIVDFHFLSILGTRVSWSEKFE